MNCGTCRWYDGTGRGERPLGACRLYPPTAVIAPNGQTHTVWPWVSPVEDWCGEWAELGKVKRGKSALEDVK